MTAAIDTGRRRRPVRAATAVTVTAVSLSVLPFSLVGASAVQIRDDLGLDDLALGTAMGSFYVVAVLASALMGRLAGRAGAVSGLRLGVLLGIASLTGIALLARGWVALAGFLAVGGLALAVLQPSADLWVTRNVPRRRHGLTYGFKQSAAPIATFTAGLALPLVALPFGWRWSYAAAAVVAVGVLLLLPRGSASGGGRGDDRTGDAQVRTLVLIAVAYALGNVGAVGLGGFFVSHAVRTGVPEGTAGVLFAASSLGVIVTRIIAGHLSDRFRSDSFLPIAGFLLAGAGACLLLAHSGRAGVYVFGPLAMVTAWGWLGLLALAVVRANPGAPAAATGITQTGGYIGAGTGPLVFGFLAHSVSYQAAWAAVAVAMCLAAACMLGAQRQLRRDTGVAANVAADVGAGAGRR